jgi:hypothetical protein
MGLRPHPFPRSSQCLFTFAISVVVHLLAKMKIQSFTVAIVCRAGLETGNVQYLSPNARRYKSSIARNVLLFIGGKAAQKSMAGYPKP